MPPAFNKSKKLSVFWKRWVVTAVFAMIFGKENTAQCAVFSLHYTVINKLITTLIMPHTPMAIELMAPCSSPISLAVEVPNA